MLFVDGTMSWPLWTAHASDRPVTNPCFPLCSKFADGTLQQYLS